MNIQKSKRIFKGVTISLVLCAFVFSILAPFASAAIITSSPYCEVLATINVREGPGLNYEIVTQYTAGYKFWCDWENERTYVVADGYTWYECPDGWIAQTGGLRFFYLDEYVGTIYGYDAEGQERWGHECTGTSNPDWGYRITVDDAGYRVVCDCGWWRYCSISFIIDPETGDFMYDFVGLDTDGDEQIDLRPGQSRKLKNRSNSDLRPYRILEFMDDPNKDPATVTLHFREPDVGLIASYTFNWSVTLHVEDYGIVMVGNDGEKIIHYVDGDFLLYDRHIGVYLADTPHEYVPNKIYGNDNGDLISGADRHQHFNFWLAPPGKGEWGDFEHVIGGIRDVFSDLGGFFDDFGGLGSVFTDKDSPIYKLTNGGFGQGVQNVFSLVRSFFSGLPEPLLAVLGTFFIISCLLGVFKLFRG